RARLDARARILARILVAVAEGALIHTCVDLDELTLLTVADALAQVVVLVQRRRAAGHAHVGNRIGEKAGRALPRLHAAVRRRVREETKGGAARLLHTDGRLINPVKVDWAGGDAGTLMSIGIIASVHAVA